MLYLIVYSFENRCKLLQHLILFLTLTNLTVSFVTAFSGVSSSNYDTAITYNTSFFKLMKAFYKLNLAWDYTDI